MSARATEGGAAAPSNVLQFPDSRRKGRIRKANNVRSMGCTALRWLEKQGEPEPVNVARLFQPAMLARQAEASEALYLALAIFARLPRKTQADIRQAARLFAEQHNSPVFYSLYKLLSGDQPS